MWSLCMDLGGERKGKREEEQQKTKSQLTFFGRGVCEEARPGRLIL